MDKHPLAVIRENDPKLFETLTDTSKLALADGAVRVACHVCGAGSVYTAAAGLNGVFGNVRPL